MSSPNATGLVINIYASLVSAFCKKILTSSGDTGKLLNLALLSLIPEFCQKVSPFEPEKKRNNLTLSNSTSNAADVVVSHESLADVIVIWFTVFSIIATVLLNGIIVVVYCTSEAMRTPFNAYILNIAVAEVLQAVTVMPGNVLRTHYGFWPYNQASCTMLLYFQQILGSAMRYGHVLVTCNRIWAVARPLTYRTAHSNRVARLLIVASWVYLHVLGLPVLIRGRSGSGPALTSKNCEYDTSFEYADTIAVEIFGFDLPELFIVLTYPYILYKLHKSRFRQPNRVAVVAPVTLETAATSIAPDKSENLVVRVASSSTASAANRPSVTAVTGAPTNTGESCLKECQQKPPVSLFFIKMTLATFLNILFQVFECTITWHGQTQGTQDTS